MDGADEWDETALSWRFESSRKNGASSWLSDDLIFIPPCELTSMGCLLVGVNDL